MLRTQCPRPNIVLVYHAQKRPKRATHTPGLLFSESARPAFIRENPAIDRNIRFVDGPVNHLGNSHGNGGALLGVPDPAFLGIRDKLDISETQPKL